MPKFRLSGDLLRAAFVEVEGNTLEEAINLAESGDFEIVTEDSNQGFQFDGTAWDESGEEIVEESPAPIVRSVEDRAALVVKWSEWFYTHADTFEGDLGLQLAYLWPAIIKAGKIEVESNDAIVELLEFEGVDRTDPIWEYIDVKDLCPKCGSDEYVDCRSPAATCDWDGRAATLALHCERCGYRMTIGEERALQLYPDLRGETK